MRIDPPPFVIERFESTWRRWLNNLYISLITSVYKEFETVSSNAEVSKPVTLVDTASASITVTLPKAADNEQRVFVVKDISSSVNTVTIDGNGSETIDDALTLVLGVRSQATLLCDGAQWHQIG